MDIKFESGFLYNFSQSNKKNPNLVLIVYIFLKSLVFIR